MVEYALSQYDVEKFMLILVRIASFMATAPIFSMASTTPRKVKIGFALTITILLFPLVPQDTVVYESMWQYGTIILSEAAVGVIIGFMANICMSILNFAGRVIDTEIGFAMVSQFDPTSGTDITVTGTIYSYFIMLLLVVTDMYQYVVRAVVDSYQLIPINGVHWNPNRLLTLVLQYITDCFIIGFRIVLPFFTVMLLLNVVLGILAKVAPQMNMFVVGMQLKIFAGLFVMVVTAYLLPSVSNFIFQEIKTIVVATIKAFS